MFSLRQSSAKHFQLNKRTTCFDCQSCQFCVNQNSQSSQSSQVISKFCSWIQTPKRTYEYLKKSCICLNLSSDIMLFKFVILKNCNTNLNPSNVQKIYLNKMLVEKSTKIDSILRFRISIKNLTLINYLTVDNMQTHTRTAASAYDRGLSKHMKTAYRQQSHS